MLRSTIIAALFAAPVFACSGMPVGFHEFGIFGAGGHVFISHYPMFSSIHAFQVVLEVELEQDAQRKFLDHASAHPAVRYTYSPYRNVTPAANRAKDQDDWVLPEKAKVGATMNGDIHFTESQTDTTMAFNVAARVVAVVQNRLLSPSDRRPALLSYIAFGDPSAPFLAHFLSAPPDPGAQEEDFDQILSVLPQGPVVPGTVYSIGSRPNDKASRLKPGETIVLVATDGTKVEAKTGAEVFTHGISTQR